MSNTGMQGTVLGFDFGLRQIGVAVLSAPMSFSTPLCVLRSRGEKPDWQALESVIKEWQPKLCVIGLPLNMDGSAGELDSRVKRFARQLEGRFGTQYGFSTTLHDERLSSHEAKEMMSEQGSSRDYVQNPADSLAAKVILDRWALAQQSS
ncbi:MAG: Holliday junction resolvase RuvX [Pseudomonadales bacterium]